MRPHLPESRRPISTEFLDLRPFEHHRPSAAHIKLASRDQSILMYPPQGSPWPHMKSESESYSVFSDSLWPHRLYSPWNSPGQNTGVGNLSLLQGIFPTQGSNPGLPHCRQILYQLSHKGSPRMLEWVAYPFSSGSSQPRNRTGVSCITGRFFTSWAIREALALHIYYRCEEERASLWASIRNNKCFQNGLLREQKSIKTFTNKTIKGGHNYVPRCGQVVCH